MKISTRGRYALRIMLDLARAEEGKYVSLKSVAERQEMSMRRTEKNSCILLIPTTSAAVLPRTRKRCFPTAAE